jgi:NAD(P)-dependent dehydrogenase (short-subunit alcohol dehydrogenase family)
VVAGKAGKTGLAPLSDLVSLEGKRALVTGSGSGIGRAIAYRFAEAGACLELVDINDEGLAAVRDELKHFNHEINVHKVNLSKKEEIDALWKMLIGKEPDVLVNNAGIYPSKPFLDVDEPFLKGVMDVNLNSVFWMCQHMIRGRLRKGGVIINMGVNRGRNAPERGVKPLRHQQGWNNGPIKSPGQRVRQAWIQNKRSGARRNMDARY